MVTIQTNNSWLDAGRVMRAHGVRGELRVELDIPCDALVGRPVRLLPRVGEPRIFTIKTGRPVHGAALITLSQVDSREDAQALAGSRLQVQQEDIPAVEPGEFYIYELQGATVVDEAGSVAGRIKRVDDNQGQALLVLENAAPVDADAAALPVPAEERELLLPLVPALVRRFDRAAHVLHVVVPPGLWED